MSLITASKLNKLWREDIDPLKNRLSDAESQVDLLSHSDKNAHIILDRFGNQMPQRSKIIFKNQPAKNSNNSESTIIGATPNLISVSVPVIEDLIYNGSTQSPEILYNQDILSMSGQTSGRNVSTYSVTFKIKDDETYQWSDGTQEDKTVEWKIKKIQIVIPTVTGNFAYDGERKTASVSDYDPDYVIVTGLSATESGTHLAVCSLRDKNNTEWTDGTNIDKNLEWTIGKATLTIPSVTSSLTYNGSLQSPEITYYNDSSLFSVTGATHTEAGDYYVTFSIKNTGNYKWEDGTIESKLVPWSIEKQLLPLVTLTSDHRYDGNVQTPTFDNFDQDKMTISGDTFATNAGIYKVTFSLSNNYQWSSGDSNDLVISWTIKKAEGYINCKSNVKIAVNASATIDVESSGTISIASNSDDIFLASLNRKIITVEYVSQGTGIITITSSETANYLEITRTVTVNSITLKEMQLILDTTKSAPHLWGVYSKDAVNMTNGSSEWDEWFGIYPCIIKNGIEIGRLNPDDFTKYLDGTSVPNEPGYDVMIFFPRKKLDVSYSDGLITITVSDDIEVLETGTEQISKYAPFYYNGTVREGFYIGAYSSSYNSENSTLESRPYTTVYTSKYVYQNGAPFSKYVKNKGEGYNLYTYQMHRYIQCLYLLKYRGNIYKSTYSKLSDYTTEYKTGSTSKKGMTLYNSTDIDSIKMFGLEDLCKNTYLFSATLLYAESSTTKQGGYQFINYDPFELEVLASEKKELYKSDRKSFPYANYLTNGVPVPGTLKGYQTNFLLGLAGFLGINTSYLNDSTYTSQYVGAYQSFNTVTNSSNTLVPLTLWTKYTLFDLYGDGYYAGGMSGESTTNPRLAYFPDSEGE